MVNTKGSVNAKDLGKIWLWLDSANYVTVLKALIPSARACSVPVTGRNEPEMGGGGGWGNTRVSFHTGNPYNTHRGGGRGRRTVKST